MFHTNCRKTFGRYFNSLIFEVWNLSQISVKLICDTCAIESAAKIILFTSLDRCCEIIVTSS